MPVARVQSCCSTANDVIGIAGQVVFNDTSGSEGMSAVQVDEKSSFMGEDTFFVGFAGEVRVGTVCWFHGPGRSFEIAESSKLHPANVFLTYVLIADAAMCSA